MSFIDDIAEAICNAHGGDTEAWEITYDKGRDHWRQVAEAALDAIAAFNASYPKQEDARYGDHQDGGELSIRGHIDCFITRGQRTMTGLNYPFDPDYGPDGKPIVKSLENVHADRVWHDRQDHEWRWLDDKWRCRRGGIWTDAWAPSASLGPYTVIENT